MKVLTFVRKMRGHLLQLVKKFQSYSIFKPQKNHLFEESSSSTRNQEMDFGQHGKWRVNYSLPRGGALGVLLARSENRPDDC